MSITAAVTSVAVAAGASAATAATIAAVAVVVVAAASIASTAMAIYSATQDTPEEASAKKHADAVNNNVLSTDGASPINQGFTEDTTKPISSTNSSAASNQVQPIQQQSSMTSQVFDANSAPDQAAQSAAAAPIDVKPVTKPIDVTPTQPVNKADSLSKTVLQTDNPMDTTVNAQGLITQAKYDTSGIKDIGSNTTLLGNQQNNNQQQSNQQPVAPITQTKSAGLLSPVDPNIQQMQNKSKPLSPKMVYNPKTNKFEMQMQ
jgi:hypothetical protein